MHIKTIFCKCKFLYKFAFKIISPQHLIAKAYLSITYSLYMYLLRKIEVSRSIRNVADEYRRSASVDVLLERIYNHKLKSTKLWYSIFILYLSKSSVIFLLLARLFLSSCSIFKLDNLSGVQTNARTQTEPNWLRVVVNK